MNTDYTAKITEIFYSVDEFCKQIEPQFKKKAIGEDGKKRRNRAFKMSDSEIITILILFHLSGYRTLKAFYPQMICKERRQHFPVVLSYNRFVEREQMVSLKLYLFLNNCCLGDCTDISIIDSTPIRVCHEKRSRRHKTFRGFATSGKGTMGWFFGFKLHIIINDRGEIVQWQLTPANTDDRTSLKNKQFTEKIFGKLVADKGYISQSLFEELFVDDIHLTRIRKNVKNSLIHLRDKIRLRKRSLIETVNDELKNIIQIEHTRHRSIGGFARISWQPWPHIVPCPRNPRLISKSSKKKGELLRPNSGLYYKQQSTVLLPF